MSTALRQMPDPEITLELGLSFRSVKLSNVESDDIWFETGQLVNWYRHVAMSEQRVEVN